MVRIRLKRLGRKKSPFYRIVVTDKRKRRDGAPLEEIGYYNPLSKDLKLDKTAALAWISKGAIPTESVKRLIDMAPESGELIQLDVKRKERLSKKAKTKAQAEQDAAAQKKAEKAAAAAAPTPEPTPEPESPAEEPEATAAE